MYQEIKLLAATQSNMMWFHCEGITIFNENLLGIVSQTSSVPPAELGAKPFIIPGAQYYRVRLFQAMKISVPHLHCVEENEVSRQISRFLKNNGIASGGAEPRQ
jgi:hypothetical protein